MYYHPSFTSSFTSLNARDEDTKKQRFLRLLDDDDDDDDEEQEEESASTLVRRAVMAARRREDDETQSLFSSYPAPTTVERQRRARERVTAALRKLKIERNLEKTPDVLGGYETKTRRRSHAVGDDSDARGRYATRRVSATEKEHFMSTPSSTPGSNRRSHSWNSISNNNAKKAGVSPLGPPRRVPADQSNSPNLISFSPAKVSSVKKTPLVSPLGPARRVLKIDQMNDLSFSNNNTLTSPATGRRMYNTPENRVYPTPETKQTQEKLKKSLLERLSKIANDSPPKSSSRKSDEFTARL